MDIRGNIRRLICTYYDITARRQAEEQIKAALAEKDVLLREIHHRVKNNLQVIASLVSLQVDTLTDESCRAEFIAVRDRVRTMALVFMDVNLVGGMDGIATATAIRQFCQVPVIFLSGNSDPNLIARTRLTGAVGAIKKLFSEHDLRNQIALALATAAMPAATAQNASSESTIS